MKIVIDTDKINDLVKNKIVTIKEKKQFLENFSDRDVFFICLVVVMSGYILSDYFDSKRFSYFEKRIGTVEVELEKLERNFDNDVLKREDPNFRFESDIPEKDSVYSLPKTKHPQLFNTRKKVTLSKSEFNCLSKNIYWESQHEPLLGQLAVANVTYNRVKSGKWGKDFCSVVYASKQFSWTNFKKIRNAEPKNKPQWVRAQHSAFLFAKGVRVTNLDESQFYYANYIKKPKWAHSMNKEANIGKHIFYSSAE